MSLVTTTQCKVCGRTSPFHHTDNEQPICICKKCKKRADDEALIKAVKQISADRQNGKFFGAYTINGICTKCLKTATMPSDLRICNNCLIMDDEKKNKIIKEELLKSLPKYVKTDEDIKHWEAALKELENF